MTNNDKSNTNESVGFKGLDSFLSNSNEESEHVTKTASESNNTTIYENKSFSKQRGQPKCEGSNDCSYQKAEQDSVHSKGKSLNWRLVGFICIGVALVAFPYLGEFKIGTTNSGNAHSLVSNTKQDSKYVKVKNVKKIPSLSSNKKTWTLYHVIADTLNVRNGPGPNYNVMDRLQEWDDVGVLNYSQSWTEIKYEGKTGWVFGQYLQKGSGEAAYLNFCYQNAGQSPISGEVLIWNGPSGLGELKVSNQTDAEALVRLRQTNGGARYVMYVGPRSSELLTKIGEGIYEVQIMYGSDYSRTCEMFIKDTFVEVFDRKIKMQETHQYGSIRYSIYSISLNKVINGNATTTRVDLTAFRN
jgi:hypothetical protein